MIYSVDVQITAPVNDTEVTDRVADAITNLFPEAEVEEHPGELMATTHQLEHFSERLHEQEILDTARGQFFSNQEGDTFSFDLKKQAAFEGRVNFAVGNPDELGDIHVRVRVTDPSVEEFVDYVAPPTQDGKPIESGDDGQ
ncbi:RNA-binding domain-containing protein [Haloarchaeobius sp. HME9146]|uniref:RNA-binding domain-containing protein n=1 Tax=Haloarchaeobius sp. HME9146 TaxID=2978732 RepID=UPI0021C11047|nr:RNA-binding domain-containing protein [Haloarchaeobius sp. HME9146]MCT9094951.1 coaE operon protein [Haloarchaeobius sp. HME9146]